MNNREVLNVLNDRRTTILSPFYSKSELEEIQKVVIDALIYKVALEELNEASMRDATSKEIKGVHEYVETISKPTGITFNVAETKGD